MSIQPIIDQVPPLWGIKRAILIVFSFFGFMGGSCLDVFTDKIPTFLLNRPLLRGGIGAVIGAILAGIVGLIISKLHKGE
ncbi:MAG: hypothetical protein XD93_0594 [candidate division WS6 bacterium 34_10]|jgi:hypothetical protein|uniref:Uncharacterized protein n=1 Tax=candidate division WS6 bacterium 34_10 TaxID=1641389 RepID=A0A101HI05_9BACT|nr:MAG: hypothetical protein XD93_0594 [candidate division WS6 bacterium 34_10]